MVPENYRLVCLHIHRGEKISFRLPTAEEAASLICAVRVRGTHLPSVFPHIRMVSTEDQDEDQEFPGRKMKWAVDFIDGKLVHVDFGSAREHQILHVMVRSAHS